MNETVIQEADWCGKAFCTISPDRSEFQEGNRGAYVVFICRADGAGKAVQLVENELYESGLVLKGVDYLFDTTFMDREISEYERLLASRLDNYPVQFENVHFFRTEA